MALSKHWLKHIQNWQYSGLSQAAYCRQHDLNANSFTGRLSEFSFLIYTMLNKVLWPLRPDSLLASSIR